MDVLGFNVALGMDVSAVNKGFQSVNAAIARYQQQQKMMNAEHSRAENAWRASDAAMRRMAASAERAANARVRAAERVANAEQRLADRTARLARQADSRAAAKANAPTNFSAIRYGFAQAGQLGSPVSDSMRGLAERALRVEEAMGGVQMSISPAEFQKFEKAARDTGRALSHELTVPVEDATRGLGVLMRAGVNPATHGFADFARHGMGLAVIEGQKFENIAETLIQLTYRLTGNIGNLNNVSDALTAASLASTVNVTGLREALKMGGPVMKQMGIPWKEQISLMALFGDSLLKGTLGGTAMSRMLQGLASQTHRSRDALKQMAFLATGSTSNAPQLWDATGKLLPLSQVLGKIGTLYNQMEAKTPGSGHGLLDRLFGMRGGQGARALMEILKDAPERLAKYNAVVANASGATMQQALAKSNNVYGALERLKNSATSVATAIMDGIGKQAAGAFNSLAAGIVNVGDAYTAMYRDGKSKHGEQGATAMFGEAAVSAAEGLSGALTGAANAFNLLTAPIRGLANMLSGVFGSGTGMRFVSFIATSVVGLSGLGLIIGMVGLAFRGLSTAAAFLTSGLTAASRAAAAQAAASGGAAAGGFLSIIGAVGRGLLRLTGIGIAVTAAELLSGAMGSTANQAKLLGDKLSNLKEHFTQQRTQAEQQFRATLYGQKEKAGYGYGTLWDMGTRREFARQTGTNHAGTPVSVQFAKESEALVSAVMSKAIDPRNPNASPIGDFRSMMGLELQHLVTGDVSRLLPAYATQDEKNVKAFDIVAANAAAEARLAVIDQISKTGSVNVAAAVEKLSGIFQAYQFTNGTAFDKMQEFLRELVLEAKKGQEKTITINNDATKSVGAHRHVNELASARAQNGAKNQYQAHASRNLGMA